MYNKKKVYNLFSEVFTLLLEFQARYCHASKHGR